MHSIPLTPDGEDSAHSAVVFVTVHGTWARRAVWARPDSALGQALLAHGHEQGREASVQPFEWSGRNSVAARRQAGVALAERLVELRSGNPDRAIYVIAHSHGGSVVAYALKHDPSLAASINGFLALATPWMHVVPCGYAYELRGMLANWAIYTIYWAFLIALPAPVGWVLDRLRPAPRPRSDDFATALGEGLGDFASDFATYGSAYFLLATVTGIVVYVFRRKLATAFAAGRPAFEQRLRDATDRVSTLGCPLPPSVFFKPIGDEAALALSLTTAIATAMQGASQLSFALLQMVRGTWMAGPRRLRRIVAVMSGITWFIGTAVLAVYIFLFRLGLVEAIQMNAKVPFISDLEDVFTLCWSATFFFALIAWVAVLLVIGAVTALTLTALVAASAVGLPAFTGGLFFNVAVEAIPSGRHQLVIVDVSAPPEQKGAALGHLSHSAVYASPGTIAAVTRALNELDTGLPV